MLSHKTSLLLAVVMVAISSPAALEAQTWEVEQMSPGVLSKDLCMLPDGQNGWFVASSAAGGLRLSAVFRTSDAGATWEELPFPEPTAVVLNGVSFVSPTDGWVVGENGVIFVTIDGGDTWAQQISGTTRTLSKVHFISSLEGWITGGWNDGSSYLVLRTTDGGISWQNQSFGNTCYSCEDVFFLNSDYGWVCGYDSGLGRHIHYTDDGGTTWVRQTVPAGSNGPVSSIEFVTPDLGWASTSSIYESPSGSILHTTDGGITWKVQGYTNLHYNYALDAQDAARVAIASVRILSPAQERVVITSDGGSTWNPKNPGIVNYTYGIQYIGSTIWIASEYSQIVRSTDDGIEWDWQHHAPLWNSLTWSDAQTGWIVAGSYVGSDGYCLRTTNGGATWERDPSAPGGAQVEFVDDLNGWMLTEGSASRVWRTTDGGATWDQHFIGTSSWIEGIFFIDANRGWAYGGNGTIRTTGDGGQTWSPQSSGTGNFVQVVLFLDPLEGWAAGGLGSGNGFIRHTTNGGANWTPQTPALGDHITAGFFLNDQEGWLSGVGGRVQKTTDGGATWQFAGSVPHTYVEKVFMLDSKNGWLVARNPLGGGPPEDGRGFLYRTTTGGSTWTIEWAAPWVKGAMTDIDQRPDGGVWACGAHNTILSHGASSSLPSAPPAPVATLIGIAPSPFTTRTSLRYSLSEESPVRLAIFDVAGRRARTLAEGVQPPGAYEFVWDGRDARGRALPSGVYFGRLKTSGQDIILKVVLGR
jgi:photosystem II stability/assembly factor-like uncharacterized protein